MNESSSLLGGSPRRHCCRKTSPYHTGQLHPAVRVADLLQHINQMKTSECYGFKQEYEVFYQYITCTTNDRDWHFWCYFPDVCKSNFKILHFLLYYHCSLFRQHLGTHQNNPIHYIFYHFGPTNNVELIITSSSVYNCLISCIVSALCVRGLWFLWFLQAITKPLCFFHCWISALVLTISRYTTPSAYFTFWFI